MQEATRVRQNSGGAACWDVGSQYASRTQLDGMIARVAGQRIESPLLLISSTKKPRSLRIHGTPDVKDLRLNWYWSLIVVKVEELLAL